VSNKKYANGIIHEQDDSLASPMPRPANREFARGIREKPGEIRELAGPDAGFDQYRTARKASGRYDEKLNL
jgi:hypothetical protein